MLFETRKRHSQLFEAGLYQQVTVFVTDFILGGNGRVLRMTNAFGSLAKQNN